MNSYSYLGNALGNWNPYEWITSTRIEKGSLFTLHESTRRVLIMLGSVEQVFEAADGGTGIVLRSGEAVRVNESMDAVMSSLGLHP